jgi:hypothetical protein
MFVNISVAFLRGGTLHRRTIETRLRDLRNARPWLEAHYPATCFIWGYCLAFYR